MTRERAKQVQDIVQAYAQGMKIEWTWSNREPLTDEERKVVDRSWERFKATVEKQDELKQASAVKEVMEPGLCMEGGEG